MMMINDENQLDDKERIIKKLKIFFLEKISVHLILIKGEWANGDIKEIREDHILLNEFKKGDLPIMFEDILDVDKYISKEVQNG